MPYGLTYQEILELLRNTVLDTSTARDIVRRSGLLQSSGAGGSGPVTVARLEFWNIYDGTELEPMSGDNYFEGSAEDAPNPVGLYYAPGTMVWLEGVLQVRIIAKTITPHATALFQTGFWHDSFLPEDPSGTERYFADTGELVYLMPGNNPNLNTEVICPLTEEYNTSEWIDLHPNWLGKDVFVGLEIRDPDPDSDPIQLGVCEMQVR